MINVSVFCLFLVAQCSPTRVTNHNRLSSNFGGGRFYVHCYSITVCWGCFGVLVLEESIGGQVKPLLRQIHSFFFWSWRSYGHRCGTRTGRFLHSCCLKPLKNPYPASQTANMSFWWLITTSLKDAPCSWNPPGMLLQWQEGAVK